MRRIAVVTGISWFRCSCRFCPRQNVPQGPLTHVDNDLSLSEDNHSSVVCRITHRKSVSSLILSMDLEKVMIPLSYYLIFSLTLSLLDACWRHSLRTRKAFLIYHLQECQSFLSARLVTMANHTDNKIGWHLFLLFLLFLVNFIDKFSMNRLIWLPIHRAVVRKRTDRRRRLREKSLANIITTTFLRENKTRSTIIWIGAVREREGGEKEARTRNS